MSLTDQLRALAVPITSSYVADNVRRKSLIYEDASKIDTQSCYSSCSKSFEKLCEMEKAFTSFGSTLFSVTSCQLEMCNLLPSEKEKLDHEISKFLCYISSFLKHFVAVQALEWLVFKFQIHLHYVEEFIRCIIPYHETGLFVKFIQILNFQQLPTCFQWLKPYAESGKAISRQEFARLCIREHTLIPFISTTILSYTEHCQGLAPARLNDMTNFFLAIVTALCDSGVPDKKLIEILDSFQGLIRQGLRSTDIVPFQCATFLVVLRFSLKLVLNQELVLDWISCILKKTRPFTEWESMRIVMQLMRNQHIPLLPPKLSLLQNTLLSKLSPEEQRIIEEEQSMLVNEYDEPNKLASECMRKFDYVRKATQFIDVDMKILESKTTEHKTDDDVLLEDELKLKIDSIHAFLSSIPNVGCCVMNCTSSCPGGPLPKSDSWLSDVLLGVFSDKFFNNTDCKQHKIHYSKLEIRRCILILRLIKSSITVHINSSKYAQEGVVTSGTLKSKCFRKSISSSCSLLQKGVDKVLPLLCACLSHPAATVRVEAYDILHFWYENDVSTDLEHKPNFSTARSAFDLNSVAQIDGLFSEEVRELLLGDPLYSLNRVASLLTKAVVRLLFSQILNLSSSEPDPENKFSTICWKVGLRLLNEDTVTEILVIPCSQSREFVRGWSGFLDLIHCSNDHFIDLHHMCLSRLNAALFASLELATLSMDSNKEGSLLSRESPDCTQTFNRNLSNIVPYQGPQFNLLDALYHLGHNNKQSDMDSVQNVFSRLHLNAVHFDYMFIKSDPSRTVGGDDRSLFTRVSEARESRRRSLRLQRTKKPDLEPLCEDKKAHFERIRLRFLSMLLTILTEAVPRLQSYETTFVQNKSKYIDTNTKITNVDIKSPNIDGKKIKGQNLPINDLITPLVNHLTSILNMEQNLKQIEKNSNQACIFEESDPDSDIESLPDNISDIHTDQEVTDISTANEDTCIRPLLRQCIYKLLICITTIFAEGNRFKPLRKRRSYWKTPTDQIGLLYSLTAAQVAVDPIFLCLTVYPDWISLHQQVLLCFNELSIMFPSALCHHLVSLVRWVACNRQLMRLDNVHNLSILGRLILVTVPSLIRASSEQISAGLYVLNLFVNRFSEFSTNLTRRRLALYTVLVRGLSKVTGPFVTASELNQRITSKQIVDEIKRSKKIETVGRGSGCNASLPPKESWLGSWLWVTSLLFLNKNWETQSVADEVGPFLIDLFCHFGWDHQVVGLCECIDFLIYLCTNSCGFQSHQVNVSGIDEGFCIEINHPLKRRKLNSSFALSSESSANNLSLAVVQSELNDNSANTSTSFNQLASFIFNSDNVNRTGEQMPISLVGNSVIITLNEMWPLINRTVQFIVVLIKNPDYCTKVQMAFSDPSGLSAVYGRLVEHIVKLMLLVATFLTKVNRSDGKSTCIITSADETLSGLQSILVQILDSVPGRVFISVISDLFSSDNHGLRRKALDLLSAKLTSLTANIQPVPILIDFTKMNYKSYLKSHKHLVSRNLVNLNRAMEAGLVQFTGKLTSFYCLKSGKTGDSQVSKHSNIFGSSFSRQCLVCLRSLAKLLAYRYPGEIMRALDSLMVMPSNWWIIAAGDTASVNSASEKSLVDSNQHENHSGSSLAESRSLACLFFVECLQCLPPQSLYPEASATTSRLSWLLSFALDHAYTSTSFASSPKLSVRKCSVNSPSKSNRYMKLVAGSMHSKDQHLLAGLTLISNLLEVAIIHRLCQQSKGDHTSDYSESEIGKWLEFEATIKKRSIDSPDQEPVAVTLLSFVFNLRKGNLSMLTGSNPERSGPIFRQISNLVEHILKLLRHVTEITYLLTSVQIVIEKASKVMSDTLLHGALSFLSDFGESIAPVEENGVFYSKDENQLHSFSVMYATQPDLTWCLLRTCLCSTVNSLSKIDLQNIIEIKNNDILLCLYRSTATLISSLPDDNSRLRICQQLFTWVQDIEGQADVTTNIRDVTDHMLLRLSIVFRIIERIPDYMNIEEFSELSKQLYIVDYIVLIFIIAVGHKFKGAKKLSNRLGFGQSLGCYADGATSNVLICVHASLSCLHKWLISEVKNVACLDTASVGESVQYIPSVLIGLLDISFPSSHAPPISEVDIQTVLGSFLNAICGDEAYLRPLGSALTEHIIHSKDWHTRLAAIRLLKFVFHHSSDHETNNNVKMDSKLSGPISCIVSDSLVALSEALEDDRSEVEIEANKLFSELEQMGLTDTKT
ncbi:HEAT repeat-containing protein isoform 1 [Schistosoma japonicum]|uniref:HEAT repeat-containing protein 1 n=3 Tax=Schistosoma japonicum TaxID=6182 RepID=A0A4Z2DLQ5_SCHJA|nr:HEAT repeat-containing protein isoform 1 [Schistosoma japonicum]